MSDHEYECILEAALLALGQALSLEKLAQLFEDPPKTAFLRQRLLALAGRWEGRGLELVDLAEGWRFRTALAMQPFLERFKEEKAPRYSRAVLETLACVAYRQPVTRGDIEEIRGVSVSSQILKTLESRGWIQVIGRRETPGRPELFATTGLFLDELGLKSLAQLPALTDIERMMDLVDPSQKEAPRPENPVSGPPELSSARRRP
jgi:segregation and condensation protein B